MATTSEKIYVSSICWLFDVVNHILMLLWYLLEQLSLLSLVSDFEDLQILLFFSRVQLHVMWEVDVQVQNGHSGYRN